MSAPGGRSLPHAVARTLLDQHAASLPDLSGLTVLVPNHRAGQDFARVLAQCAGRFAYLLVLIPPRITPLKSWADQASGDRGEPQARRLARLHGVLRRVDWLGKVDKWALANELLGLADELSAARLGGSIGSRIRALHADNLDRETALIEAVWQALNTDGNDPQARYARALDVLLAQIATAPQPIYGFALGTLTAVEQQFLERCAERTMVRLEFAADAEDAVAFTLQQAWQLTDPPLRERAAALAAVHAQSPLRACLTLCPAPHLEAEARAVATWVAAQLQGGKRDIALIALDRETARRVRALLERMDVLVADETGWTLSTTAAAAVIDRWLECVTGDFPHVELLDLLKSPFLLGDLAARQDQVLQFELALRRHGVSQGMADMRRLAHAQFGALPAWLATLFNARQSFAQSRASLAIWLTRLIESLAQTRRHRCAQCRRRRRSRARYARHPAPRPRRRQRKIRPRRMAALAQSGLGIRQLHRRQRRQPHRADLAARRARSRVRRRGGDWRRRPSPARAPRARPVFPVHPRAARSADRSYRSRAATTDLLQLLTQGPALLSWQAWHDDEPNPASPLVLRLQALHQAAWGADLPQASQRRTACANQRAA